MTLYVVALSKEKRAELVARWFNELNRSHGSDSQIARELEVHPASVLRWRRGQEISLPNLVKIAELSEHSLGDMMMALYGVAPEALVPTAPVTRADQVVWADRSGPRPLAGRYRLMLAFREDDANQQWGPPPPRH